MNRPHSQAQLPFFPAGSVEFNRELACRTGGTRVVYFNGQLPVCWIRVVNPIYPASSTTGSMGG